LLIVSHLSLLPLPGIVSRSQQNTRATSLYAAARPRAVLARSPR
jgi:hypothetical protein